jgi:signal transduction histidine kinase
VARDAFQRIVDAQELERKRLSRELHDQTGQELTSVLLGLKAIEDASDADERGRAVAAVRAQVLETLNAVRRLAVELRPKALDDFGLVPALERLLETWRQQTGIHADFEARVDGRLPGNAETVLYRIVQEALTNVVKHAAASRVSVVLTQNADTVTAVVEDDGNGFAREANGDGLGLLGMRERLALVGGSLKVESAEGAGTTVVADIPVR